MIVGKPGSHVHGAIIQGIFRGTILVPSDKEVYHVEKSNRFFNDQPVFHSVIYKESDMNFDPYRYVLLCVFPPRCLRDTCFKQTDGKGLFLCMS